MNATQTDLYKTLGVDINADASAIKTAYRKLVLKCHPDKVQDPALKVAKQDEFQRVQQAYEILGDETKRREYDDDVRLRKLREKLARSMTTPSPSSPKEYNVHTAEPPPFSTYTSGGSPHFTRSWDHGIPHRAKKTYDEEAHARTSYEPKDERRRRKEYEPQTTSYDSMREKKPRADRDKRDKDSKRDRDRLRKELEKREREKMQDTQRRAEQQEKSRLRRSTPSYSDSHNDYEYLQTKKKTAAASPAAATASTGASSKRDTASPRREKSTPRAGSPPDEAKPDKIEHKTEAAAKYMSKTKARAGAFSSSATPTSEEHPPNPNPPDPETWRSSTDSRRPRRPSPGEKPFHVTVEEEPDVADFMGSPLSGPRKSRLDKIHTSPPVGLDRMHSSPSAFSPLRRYPSLSRSATMDHSRFSSESPAAPHIPFVESSRHSSKSDRRRRGSADVYDDSRAHRVTSHSRSARYTDSDQDLPRAKSSRYADNSYAYYTPPMDGVDHRLYGSPKLSAYSRDLIHQSRHFAPEDVAYSNLPHSSHHYAAY